MLRVSVKLAELFGIGATVGISDNAVSYETVTFKTSR